MKLPRYYLGIWQHHLDLADKKVTSPDGRQLQVGEYHCWTPDDPALPDSPMYVMVCSDTPHPAWIPLPHILNSTPIAPEIAQYSHPKFPILPTDTTFSFIQRIGAQFQTFGL